MPASYCDVIKLGIATQVCCNVYRRPFRTGKLIQT